MFGFMSYFSNRGLKKLLAKASEDQEMDSEELNQIYTASYESSSVYQGAR